MAVEFTKEQQAVIDARDCNILVSAAAGSGKTAVLVERIIQMITSDMDIDHLLVVTFTKAAASQMREKITLAIADKLKEDPDKQLFINNMNKVSPTVFNDAAKETIKNDYLKERTLNDNNKLSIRYNDEGTIP